MKRAFILFWHGLTGILAGVANWFTVILGMKDDSKYGKFIRRVVGSCFAFLMLLLAIAAGWDFCRTACYRLALDKHFNDSYYDTQYISGSVTYYICYDGDNYLKTSGGKKTITGIKWIAKPLGTDSLICYSDGKKRGYFNMSTGKSVIEPKYDHAWIFSDGLASVDDNGWIKFVDVTGKVVIDPRIPYRYGMDGYVFHNNHCVVHNGRCDRVGLIDRQGNWTLEPEYSSIEQADTFWIVDNGKEKSVLTDKMKTVVPFIPGRLWIYDGMISATMADHSIRRYNLQGEQIEDFYINSIEYLTYETPELRFTKTKNCDEEGNLVSETEESEASHVLATAKCKRYEAETGWYGLMTTEGKVITPPSYSSITAVGYDLYLCKDNNEDGVLLDGKGRQVK